MRPCACHCMLDHLVSDVSLGDVEASDVAASRRECGIWTLNLCSLSYSASNQSLKCSHKWRSVSTARPPSMCVSLPITPIEASSSL